jgi:hypothetical protein
MPFHALPLCVDLDGTLARTDLPVESLLVLVKHSAYRHTFGAECVSHSRKHLSPSPPFE